MRGRGFEGIKWECFLETNLKSNINVGWPALIGRPFGEFRVESRGKFRVESVE